jgi:hypothetical protein
VAACAGFATTGRRRLGGDNGRADRYVLRYAQ